MENKQLEYVIINNEICEISKTENIYNITIEDYKELEEYLYQYIIPKVLIKIIILYYLEIRKIDYTVEYNENKSIEEIELKNKFSVFNYELSFSIAIYAQNNNYYKWRKKENITISYTSWDINFITIYFSIYNCTKSVLRKYVCDKIENIHYKHIKRKTDLDKEIIENMEREK